MLRLASLILAGIVLLAGSGSAAAAGELYPALYEEAGPFLTAIRRSRTPPLAEKVTGLTVPHHLLAADLIAEAWARVSSQGYERIIILSPDHFSRSRTPFAVSVRCFETALGPVVTDAEAVRQILENRAVTAANLFSHEHGVQALMPFAAYYFPQAKVVALAIRGSATQADCDQLAETLKPLMTPKTLVIQSTDFSHYLPADQARNRDQETLRVLSGGEPEGIWGLKEPEHLDSKGAQYLQLRLQSQVFRAKPMVIANRNSQEYASEPVNRTTSYIVQLYSPTEITEPGGKRYFFAGDTFCGRAMAVKLAREEFRENLVVKVLKVTGGADLIINLEGVIKPGCTQEAGPYDLCMPADLTVPLLQRLKVRAVSLANNHSRDFGAGAYRTMVRLLNKAGIAVLENHNVYDLKDFRLAAYTDVDNRSPQKAAILRREDFGKLDTVKRDKPLFAFLHWGQEYSLEPGRREEALINVFTAKGVELIVGCHSHRASTLTRRQQTCLAFSLGNFIFDQRRPEVSGALLEAVFFPQGTYFLKRHALENFFATVSGES